MLIVFWTKCFTKLMSKTTGMFEQLLIGETSPRIELRSCLLYCRFVLCPTTSESREPSWWAELLNYWRPEHYYVIDFQNHARSLDRLKKNVSLHLWHSSGALGAPALGIWGNMLRHMSIHMIYKLQIRRQILTDFINQIKKCHELLDRHVL